MGQAFCRASGRIRSSTLDTSSSPHLKKAADRPQPAVPPYKLPARLSPE